ncbi:MAG TPA: ABC transporter substrate-binding protein [Methanocorpusculum sp.]|nr:ABC transporter substrate-binding protein [Methanocorpusculum sp.]
MTKQQKLKIKKQHHSSHKKYFGGRTLTLIIFIALIIFLFLAAYSPNSYNSREDGGSYIIPVMITNDTIDGREYLRGIEMAVEDKNRIREIPIVRNFFCEIIPAYMDYGKNETNASVAEYALTNYYTAYNMEMPVILGPESSSGMEAIAPSAETLHTAILSPGASSTALRAYPDYVYSLYPSDSYLSATLASTVAAFFEDDGEHSLAVVYDTGAYAAGIMEQVEDELDNYPALNVSYFDLGTAADNIKETAEKVRMINSEFIMFLPGSYEQGTAFVSEVLKLGVYTTWAGTEYCLSDKTAALFDGKNGYFYVFSPSNTIIDDDFIRRYEERYGSKCTIEAAYGYDAMMILSTIIQDGHGETAEDAAVHLKNMRYIGVTGMISFDETGAQFPKYDVLSAQNGRWNTETWKDILSFENEHEY